MRRTAWVLVIIVLAIALQTTLALFVVWGTVAIDVVLVAVVCMALTMGPVTGLLAGSVAGLIQDALSSGVVGIGGLSKSLVGCLAGAFGRQFIVTGTVPRLVVFACATVLHAAVVIGMYTALRLRTFESPGAAVASQALGNMVFGIIVFTVLEGVPGVLERRRLSRRRD